MRLPVLVGGGQMCLSYNQIAGFFDEHEEAKGCFEPPKCDPGVCP